MTLRPKIMLGHDLDRAVTACAHLLSCDPRYGTMDHGVRVFLEKLLDEGAIEQAERRKIAQSAEPVGPSRPD